MTRRDERGAVAAMTAIMLTVIVGMAAFAVDLGMQRVVRSDMQALADVVALDAARLLDGRKAGAIRAGTGDPEALATVVTASAARHSTLGDVDGVTGHLVYLAEGPNGEQLPKRDAAGALVTVADDQLPEAVYVVASGSVDFSFAPGSGGATRSALGIASSAACFTLGSYAASLEPGAATFYGNLLKPLVGATTLGLVGYQGLATARIALIDILSAPSIGVGTVDGILAAPEVTVGDFYLAMAHALQGDGQVLEATVLQTAATKAVGGLVIDLGGLFGLTTASDSVLETRFNALDLLVGAAFLASGQNLVMSPLQAGNPAVGATNTTLKIIELPQRACDQDEARTAQFSLTSEIKVPLSNEPLIQTGSAKLRMLDSDAPDLFLDAFLGGARGSLTSVTCEPDLFEAQVWTELSRARLSGTVQMGGELRIALVNDLDVELTVDVPVEFEVTVAADAYQPQATSATPVEFGVPPKAYGESVTMGGTDIVLPYLSASMVAGSLKIAPVAGFSAEAVEAKIAPLVATVVPQIGSKFDAPTRGLIDEVNGIFSAFLQGAGVTLAGADFYGLERPRCNAPRLRG